MESLPDQLLPPRRVSISAWSSNFEDLLSDPIGIKAFEVLNQFLFLNMNKITFTKFEFKFLFILQGFSVA